MSETFSTTLPLIIDTRPQRQGSDWQELDRGPGIFHLPPGLDVGIRVKGFNDAMLQTLVSEMVDCLQVVSLNLAENRNISNTGIACLKAMRQLVELNLSSCGITNLGLETIAALPRLSRLDLSYCNRITDLGIKRLKALPDLQYLDLQGCIKVTHSGMIKISRSGLSIHK